MAGRKETEMLYVWPMSQFVRWLSVNSSCTTSLQPPVSSVPQSARFGNVPFTLKWSSEQQAHACWHQTA